MKPLALLLALCLPLIASAAPSESYEQQIANLIDPAKLATLRNRAVNLRLKKVVALLEDARRAGGNVTMVVSNAVRIAGYTNVPQSSVARGTLAHNHELAGGFGVLTDEGLADLRRGLSPTITQGRHKGDKLSVDQCIPIAAAPELENVIANLELVPEKKDEAKSGTIGVKEMGFAKVFVQVGLMTQERFAQLQERAEYTMPPMFPARVAAPLPMPGFKQFILPDGSPVTICVTNIMPKQVFDMMVRSGPYPWLFTNVPASNILSNEDWMRRNEERMRAMREGLKGTNAPAAH